MVREPRGRRHGISTSRGAKLSAPRGEWSASGLARERSKSVALEYGLAPTNVPKVSGIGGVLARRRRALGVVIP